MLEFASEVPNRYSIPSISSIIFPQCHKVLSSLYPGMEIFYVRGLGGLWRRPAAAKNGMKIMLLRIRLLSPPENLSYNTIGKIFTRTVFFFVTPLRLPDDQRFYFVTYDQLYITRSPNGQLLRINERVSGHKK